MIEKSAELRLKELERLLELALRVDAADVDPVEILYAVDTSSPIGASVKASGEVEIGFDGLGVLEFSNH